MKAARDLLAELFTSKKFVAFIVGVLLIATNAVGLNLTEVQLAEVVGLVATYIFGQGVADHGKGAEQVKVEAAKLGVSSTSATVEVSATEAAPPIDPAPKKPRTKRPTTTTE